MDAANTEYSVAVEKARGLLQSDEYELPPGVGSTIDFFVSCGAWFKLSRNPSVTSCRDAAARRWRLGYRGISMSDELRSYLAQTSTSDGLKYVLFHCRGDTVFDFDKIAQITELRGLEFSKADVSELSNQFIGYGLINPFVAPDILERSGAKVIQVLDESVLDGSGETRTMMTNAGDLTWAIEFDPVDLMQRVPSLAIVAKIASGHQQSAQTIGSIGILTGNAPESGALLWRKINDTYRRLRGETFRGDISYPKVIVHSLPAMGWSMELSDRDEMLRKAIEAEVGIICATDIASLAFACNTTQYYGPQLAERISKNGVTFVSLSAAVEAWLGQRLNQTFMLAGIGHVTRSDEWSAFTRVLALPNVRTPDESLSKQIDTLAYEIKRGLTVDKAYQKFRKIVRSCREENVLLLLTELSMIFEKFPRAIIGPTHIVDAMDIYADAIVEDASRNPRVGRAL